MLQLILGRAGTGKTQYLINQINRCAKKNEKCLLIVPEQFTVSAEKIVVNKVEAAYLKNVEVLNFRRLVNKVFRDIPFFRGEYIEGAGKYALMALALDAVKDNLTTYKNVKSIRFVEKLINVAQELKYYCISPELFEEKARLIKDELRKNKLSDLALIILAYNALLADGFKDEKDDLDVLTTLLLEHNTLKDYIVFFDAFHSFSPQEFSVIKGCLKSAKDCFFSFCTDELSDKEGGYGLFSTAKATARKIMDLAEKLHLNINEPIILEKPYRFAGEDLKHLENNIFKTGPSRYSEKAENITIYSAKEAFDEIGFIANEISRLVREQGYHYRDFLVIGRAVEEYRGIIDTIFLRYNIPCFEDKKSDLLSKPLVLLITNALNIAIYGFEADYLLSYLKTGLTNISEEELCIFENYIYEWSINRQGFTKEEPWNFNPDGYKKDVSENGKSLLIKLNALKNEIITPLMRFCNKVKNANALVISQAIYELLHYLDVPNRLKLGADEYESRGEKALAAEQKQIFDIFIKALDQMVLVLKEDAIAIKNYSSLFHLVLSNYSIGKIPTSLDEVVIGNADRVRPYNPLCVFVIGVNDGVFPKIHKDDNIITDADREEFSNLDVQLAPSTFDLSFEERLYAYSAFTCAKEKVYVTYSKIGLDGKEARPSYLIGQIKSILPFCKNIDFSEIELIHKIQQKNAAFDLYACIKNDKDKKEYSIALERFFEKEENFSQRLQSIKKVENFAKHERLQSKESIEGIYGKDLRLSASRAETFHNCKFSYFCKYGLRAKVRNKAQLAAPEIGSFIHHILENAVKETSAGVKKLYEMTDEEIFLLSQRLSKSYLEDYLGSTEQSARFLYLFKRISESVATLLRNLAKEFSQCGFLPTDFELSINEKDGIKPLMIELPDGASISINGFVDRVDILEKDGIKYFRVVDYKTGEKVFSLNDVVNGLNIQMFIYLFAIWENGKEYYGGSVLPAGILYYPAKTPILKLGRHSDEEEIEKELQKNLKMNGLMLDNMDILLAMERELEGSFIPVKRTKDGFSSKSIASLSQFGKLKSYIEKLLKQMGEEIFKGDIALNPFKDSKLNSCRYCDMKSICGIEPGRGKPRRLKQLDTQELWNEVEKEGDMNA